MKKILTLSIIYLFYGFSFAQSLQLDTTFNSSDLGFDYGKGFNSYAFYPYNIYYVHCTLKQPDGKIIIGGRYNKYNNTEFSAYGGGKPFRINNDGSIDSSFNFYGQSTNTWKINTMELQPDGKIILINNNNNILRLNPDGSLDNSFQLFFTPGSNQEIKNCMLQPDGKIIVAGKFASSSLIPNNSLIRVNNDGSLDPTFNLGGNGALFGYQYGDISTYVNKMILQSDGKIIITGNFAAYNGVARKNIARLNIDGTIDLSFNPGSGFNDSGEPILNSLTLQADGKLLVGGQFSGYNGNTKRSLVRINTDGSDDSTFVTGLGFSYTNTSVMGNSPARVNSTVLLADGRIVVGGAFERYNGVSQNSITCLNSDGSLNTTFNSGIGLYKPYGSYSSVYEEMKYLGVHTLNLLSNEKILISGKFPRYDNTWATNLVKVDYGGTIDLSFNSTTGFDELVNCSAIQPDGKILVGGYFTKYNNTNKRGLVRLNTDGSIDNSFAIGSGIYTTNIDRINQLSIRSITIQPDNKILIAGYFESFNGITKNCIVRLNSDGTIDTSFSLTSTIDINYYFSIYSVVLQNDGKILLIANTSSGKKIFRLNPDGSLDNSFTPVNNGLMDLFFLQPDGKILYLLDGALKRLNNNGTLDTSFSSVWIDNTSSGIVIDIQNDNKIIIAGNFTNVNGSSVPRIARLNSDGTLDYSFYPTGVSFLQNSAIHEIKIMPNGKILIAGDNSNNFFLYRLSSSGGLETSFSDLQINSNLNGNGISWFGIKNITIENNGSIYVGGGFNSFGADGRNRFARLTENTLETNTFNEYQPFKIYPNPTENILNIDMNEDCIINSVQIFNLLGQKVITSEQHKKTIDVSFLKNGIYLIKMNTNYGTLSSSFIKK